MPNGIGNLNRPARVGASLDETSSLPKSKITENRPTDVAPIDLSLVAERANQIEVEAREVEARATTIQSAAHVLEAKASQESAKRFACIRDYSRALLPLKNLEAIRTLTAECVSEALKVDHAHVFMARTETEEARLHAVFETGKVRLKNQLSHENELTVPVEGSSGVIAVIRALNKSDWTDFSDEDVRVLEAIATSLGLKLDNLRLELELKTQLQSSIQALAQTIETKDRYTGGHTKRVFAYADALVNELPLSEEEREKVRLAGLLHDIGKIGVPDRILQKPSELTAAEWTEMERHTDWGYDIVSRVSGLEEIAEILRFHHERWDGNGYPTGLKGTSIPYASRIIAVADTFDAMVTERPYRQAMQPSEARILIRSLSGTQFDPTVVAAFEAAYARLEKLATEAVVPQSERVI